MPTEVILPRVDMDMTEGMIAAWHVNEGDEVREGTLIFEIETSKATFEVDAPASGIIRQISAPVGETVPVGVAVAWIYASGEALKDHGDHNSLSQQQVDTQPVRQEPEEVADVRGVPIDTGTPDNPETVRATPAARRVARERGLQLISVAGSGPHGRVCAADVLRANAGDDQIHVRSTAQHLHTQWLRKGSGSPLVMLHGFAAELNSWRPFGKALSRVAGANLGMLAVDLPAHGKSSDEEAGSLESITAAIEQTLSAEGIEDCHLIGHSFGGAIALAMAAAASQVQIRSLTLLAPGGLGPECNGGFIKGLTLASRRASLEPWLRQLFANPSLLDEAFIATAEQQLASAEVRERLSTLADVFFPDGVQSVDLRQALNGLDVPVKVIWGLQDRVLPARHADGLPGRVGVHRFANVGHLPHVEAQDEVAIIAAENIRSASTQSNCRQEAAG
ncbi:acetoin dehydrogenase dihydrolipoyllysine-residue acetyltransferase subunit [Paraburkholderia aspalathi]|uniref:acetoin dehydrogenase dihydrolipoyllysine-residue acetyltransferase subunit n=1 Tax=Paraburkholderia aspalathi TaxID=1324617 RepID=UPI0019094CDD|nr:acetoin dehydrogenase dihydrolipoyllysine-residue acetyltransferase subunit [Paraburkholderia aspalathi]MBK3843907.1 acetoin dehydrogenase dihydrolipoyllysine-residue acetyltransferase subunit [Paraburkholderia aspalathi]